MEELILEHLNINGDIEDTASQKKGSIVQDYMGSLSDKKKLAAIQQESYDNELASQLPDIGMIDFTHL